MLKDILSVSGRPGLFKFLSKTKSMFVVESLLTHKRILISPREKISSLDKIFIYAKTTEISLSVILNTVKEKEEGNEIAFEISRATDEVLEDYFLTILPEYDRNRVYPFHIKKILSWYNLLIKEKFSCFSEKK